MKILLTSILLTIVGCASKNYQGELPRFERDKFMGDWYVQAGRFTFLEKDVHNGLERYSWNSSKNRIDIDFSYNVGSLTGQKKKFRSKAWIEDPATPAKWKFQMFWPLTVDQLILAVDAEYRWTAVGVPNQKYLWIMSRTPTFPREKIEEILAQLKALGYDTSSIVYVPHDPGI